MPMKKILTIGGATKDIFIAYQEAQMAHLCLHEGKRSFLILEDGKKVEIETLEYHTGGGATNAAVGFARLGLKVSIVCKVGADQEGAVIVQSLNNEHIDTTSVVYSDTLPTATSFIVPTEHGNRIALVYRGAGTTLEENELPVDQIKKSDILYITSLGGNSQDLLLPLVALGKKNNRIIVVNPGTSQLNTGTKILCQSLQYIDIFILNTHEACCCMSALMQEDQELHATLFNKEKQSKQVALPQLLQAPLFHHGLCFSLHTFFKEVHKKGPKIIVVTNGKEGVYVSSNDTIFFHPSLSSHVVSTLGAGDAFGSGFVGMYAHDYSIEDCIRAGMLNSSSVIGHVGAKVGLLTFQVMNEALKSISKDLLKIFPL